MDRCPRFTKSLDRQIIEERLATAQPGDVLTYATIAAWIGKDPRDLSAYYGLLRNARLSVMREHRIVFRTIHGHGLQRIENENLAAVGRERILRSRRQVKHGLREIACAEFDDLPQDKKREFLAVQCGLGVLALASAPKAMRRIEDAIPANDPRLLPSAAILDLFKKA